MEKYYKEIMKIIEGTCGYGIDGKLGESPAGPHLLKKQKDIEEDVHRQIHLISKCLI